MDFLGWLFILFLGLKLAGVIAWSWWWVFLPIYFIPVLGVLSWIFGISIITIWLTPKKLRTVFKNKRRYKAMMNGKDEETIF